MMKRQISLAAKPPAAAPRARWTALFSLLLLLIVPQAHLLVEHASAENLPARAQLKHDRVVQPSISQPPAPHALHASAEAGTDAGDLCMLCSVFGSARQPAALRLAPPALRARSVQPASDPGVAPRPPTLDLLSRPPPALLPAPSQEWPGFAAS